MLAVYSHRESYKYRACMQKEATSLKFMSQAIHMERLQGEAVRVFIGSDHFTPTVECRRSPWPGPVFRWTSSRCGDVCDWQCHGYSRTLSREQPSWARNTPAGQKDKTKKKHARKSLILRKQFSGDKRMANQRRYRKVVYESHTWIKAALCPHSSCA